METNIYTMWQWRSRWWQHLVAALEEEWWIMKAAVAGDHQEGGHGLCSDPETWVRPR